MKTKWFSILFLIAGLVITSCQPKNAEETPRDGARTSANASGTNKTETPHEKELAINKESHAFPSELLHEGARYFGAPFEKPISFRVTGGGETLTDTRTLRVLSVKDGVAKVEATWKGKMAQQVGSEVYEINKKGIYATAIRGVSIEPKIFFLPASLTKGKTWTTKYSFSSPIMGNLSIESKYKIVGEEKVTVSLGTYDAIVVSETGTLKGENITMNISSRSYFAEGIGIIKLVSTQKGKVNNQPKEIRLEFEAVPGD